MSLAFAAAAEQGSEHPIASDRRARRSAGCRSGGREFSTVPDRGSTRWRLKAAALGSRALMEARRRRDGLGRARGLAQAGRPSV